MRNMVAFHLSKDELIDKITSGNIPPPRLRNNSGNLFGYTIVFA
ncbi:MAG: hypothetical protein ACR2I2_02015 [Bryobacteraceae bacterium]